MKPLAAVLVSLALSILHPWKLDGLPPEHSLVKRYTSAAEDCVEAVTTELPGASEREVEKYARSLYLWSYDEASWYRNPFGCKPGTKDCTKAGVVIGTNDSGHACGVGQVHVDTIQSLSNWKGVLEPEWTCASVRKDRVLGYRAMLRVLLRLESDCGSTAAGWSAYAGTLGCVSYVKPLVKSRCKRAGLTELCEMPP